jgi:putative protein-disulfide isomerase
VKKILHYIYDPMCSWSYAAEPLIEAASGLADAVDDQLELRLHGGGLFAGEVMSSAKRTHFRVADAHIGDLTGQLFGGEYLNGVLADPSIRYDSTPPITAILAAEAIRPLAGLKMLRAVQYAHYRDGLRAIEPAVLARLAADVGLDEDEYATAYDAIAAGAVQEHIKTTRLFMRSVGAVGFPTFILQVGHSFQVVHHKNYYGRPRAFVAEIAERLEMAQPISVVQGTARYLESEAPLSECTDECCAGHSGDAACQRG